ncbi:MAG: dTMP kinase [Leptospiraceae bacterium]|nr:dTMP kinase [Leptospiraceae bacterium]MBK7054391.1 dTMP kinase [Leptospiraceae bacterium]MBK9498761.1 dTMP kinase [Leptospiraceae bacterium]MBL0262630.1 dTMP kinase [Leptospiraceae bacterium]MBP9162551.1 dTMP kinase [Leptospiraceae bacterium]
MNKTKFIVFEGIDGSGKSTLSTMVLNSLIERNFPIVKFNEPTSFETGMKIRKFLRKEISLSREEQIELFLADRKDSLEKNVYPNLKAGNSVILDRYFYSMAAYQSDESIQPETILRMNLNRNYPVPDLIIYLEINPEISLARTKRRNANEHFENLETLKKVSLAYEKVIPKTALKLDATLSQAKLKELCISHIIR